MNIKNYILISTIASVIIGLSGSVCYACGATTWSTTSSGDEACALAGGTCNAGTACDLSGNSIDCSTVAGVSVSSSVGSPGGGSADCTITSGVGTTWGGVWPYNSSTGNVECAGLGRLCTDEYSYGVETTYGCDDGIGIPVASAVGSPGLEGTALCGDTLPTDCATSTLGATKNYIWSGTDNTGLAMSWAAPGYAGGNTGNYAYMGPRNVRITYGVSLITTATSVINGSSMPPATTVNTGDTVAAGTQLLLSFIPHANTDISWNVPGNGTWVANAAAAGHSADVVDCSCGYLVSSCLPRSGGLCSTGYNLSYASLLVAPPTETTTIPAGMSSCSGLTCNANYGYSETCTINSTSTFSFNFLATFGKYYYRMGLLTGSVVGSPTCYDNANVPLAYSGTSDTGTCSGSVGSRANGAGEPYSLNIPTISIPYTLYVPIAGVCGTANNKTYPSVANITGMDYMEYSTNALARANPGGYISTDATRTYGSDVTPTMTSDTAPSPYVASASSESSSTYAAWKAFDANTTSTYWKTTTTTGAGYLEFDFGSGNTKTATEVAITSGQTASDAPTSFTLLGSNDDSTCRNTGGTAWSSDLLSGTGTATWASAYLTKIFYFNNETGYRCYKLNISTTNSSSYVEIAEMQLYQTASEGNLVAYSNSNSSYYTQGSYSLEGVAVITNSANDTLTKTIATPINLTGASTLYFDIYSSRAGSNIKLGIHDAGGTTSTTTPNITSAGAWQTVSWDISGVSAANKDAIDKIIITILNATAANTFYIDNFYASTPPPTAFGSDTLCSPGNPNPVSPPFPTTALPTTTWTCNALNETIIYQTGATCTSPCNSPNCTASLNVPIPGTCGTAAKSYLYTDTAFSGTMCGLGNGVVTYTFGSGFPTPGGTTTWTCGGSNGGGPSPTCTATRAPTPVNGTCGLNTNNTTSWTYANTATAYLGGTTLNTYYCSTGTASTMPAFPAAGSSASWTCNCTGTGCTTQTCTATIAPPAVNGTCGTAAKIYLYTDTDFSGTMCGLGNGVVTYTFGSGFPALGGTTTWTCGGSNGGGPSPTCTATRAPTPVNGACGTAATS